MNRLMGFKNQSARYLLCCALAFLPNIGFAAAPTYAQVKAQFKSSDVVILDRNGESLQQLRVDHRVRRLQWIEIRDISPALLRAVIAAEDKHFYEHHGVDWSALSKAAWDNLTRSRPRGASTITMQLAAMLDDSLKPTRDGRTLQQKWHQIETARDIEAHWSKAQIFEAYLNEIYFRGDLRGISAAAQGLFGKVPSGLKNDESLLLAASIRSPAASRDRVAQRACVLANDLKWPSHCENLKWLAEVALGRRDQNDEPATGLTAALAKKLAADSFKQTQPLRTTLDISLQRFALASLQQHISELKARNINDGAVVVIDNASSEVLAYVANFGESEVDGVTAMRQAGSTLKPFLYELAIEKRYLTAASILDDSPLDIATPSGLYVPQNYDKDFKGPVSVRTSLGNSLNVPAVRTLLLNGVESFHARLRALGFDSLKQSADYYGYSLALGSAEVNLLELSNAYRALANQGQWHPLKFFPQDVGVDRGVMDPNASFIVSDILSDNSARALTFGLDSALALRSWSAVKTGTSKDMRDNWCVGFSDRYTVGVWVGNFNGEPMWDVSGVTGAAPVWRDVMTYLHNSVPSNAPVLPSGVVARKIEFKPAIESARKEWFIEGTESDVVTIANPQQKIANILYPGNGVVIAIDPDIPLQNQRVRFKAAGGANLTWQLDGKASGSAAVDHDWLPAQGRHNLYLVDVNKKLVDKVQFDVRGIIR